MRTEIIDDTKTAFGNDTAINYYLEKGDDLISFIAENANKWSKNSTLVLLDEDVVGRLLVEAHDYEITGIGVCEFYFDPLSEQVLTIRKTKNDMFYIEHAILDNATYSHAQYQAYSSQVSLVMKMKEKTKLRG